ncbi:flavin reductase [Candidatus Woesearchaeota archaeon]|nr:flavin reductase [Candidatus Woesearchaeota archaeon]
MIQNIIEREDLFPKVLVSVRAPVNNFGKSSLKDAISVIEWHMPASTRPMKYAISVRSDDNIKHMISTAGNFVINFMSHEHKSIVLSCENQDSLFTDLFEFLGVTKSDADMVESPRIREAKEFLECEVDQELDSGDHIIFIGKVVGPRV